MEGFNRIDDALDFFVSETGLFEADPMLSKPQRLLSEPLRGLLILRFVSNHGDAPGFSLMMPRGFPSRRDWRKADGNSSSCPLGSRMPLKNPATCGQSSTRYRCHMGS